MNINNLADISGIQGPSCHVSIASKVDILLDDLNMTSGDTMYIRSA